MPPIETVITKIQSGIRPAAGRISGTIKAFFVAAVCLALAVSMTVGVPPASANDGNEEKAAEPNWQRLDKALALAKDSGKLIIVNFYTDWCPNCKRMNEKTYRDDGVLKQLSKSFISVKLNAESSRPLIIEGQAVTEAQVALMFRVNSYPTTWFLTADGRPLLPVRGYYGPELFAPMLRFVEGGWYEKMDFDMYMEREKKR
jgi:thioredoxin-related protein